MKSRLQYYKNVCRWNYPVQERKTSLGNGTKVGKNITTQFHGITLYLKEIKKEIETIHTPVNLFH